MSTVLVVDDEERVRTFLRRALAAQGHVVLTAETGQGALDVLDTQAVDLVLLDIVMPEMNGLQCVAAIAEGPQNPPVIMLSGVSDVAARVTALDRGAVDFVGKPFHLSELMARTRRHLAGGPKQRSEERYLEAGSLRLDVDRRRAHTSAGVTRLAERETALLAHLMRRRGDVCRKDELLHDVWGLDFDTGSNVVEVCLRRLRAKLEGLPVETVRGVGYCFVGD
jgi:DNA-binding response OmpR family regulator